MALFTRGFFEAVFLGRRGECLGCHNGEASVTDHDDPARDRNVDGPRQFIMIVGEADCG